MTATWQSWQNRVLVGVMNFVTRYQRPMGSGYRGVRRTLDETGRCLPAAKDVRWTRVDAGGVPGEWIEAPGVRRDRALLYLHGGGYVSGSPMSHRGLIGELSRRAGVRVLALDYRLAPEHPFPAALDDAVAGYTWLLTRGLRPEHVTIGGDSAGGGLTVATLLKLRERGLAQPAAAVLLSPWVDLEGTGASLTTRAHLDPMLKPVAFPLVARHYVGDEGDLRHPLVSPIHADLSGLAPMLVQVGTREVLLDDARRLVERIHAAGGRAELEVWDHMVHVWQIFRFLPEARRAVAHLGNFIRRHTDRPE